MAENVLAAANKAFAEGKYESALEQYDEVLQTNEAAEVYSNRAAALRALGRNEEALESVDYALTLKEDLADAWFNRALIQQALEQYDGALESFDGYLYYEPEAAKAWYGKASLLNKLGRYEEAIESATQALEYDNMNGLVETELAFAQMHMDAYTEAVDTLTPLIEAGTASARAKQIYAVSYSKWGIALEQEGDYEGAVTCFDNAIAVEPSESRYFNKGVSLVSGEKMVEAIEAFKEAFALNPENHGTLITLGNLYFQQEKWGEGVAAVEKALSMSPEAAKDAVVMHNLGFGYLKLENNAKALENFKAAIALDPSMESAAQAVKVLEEVGVSPGGGGGGGGSGKSGAEEGKEAEDRRATARSTIKKLRKSAASIASIGKVRAMAKLWAGRIKK